MRPHYFTLALHGITDDWGECRRLELTAEGEFWCGKAKPAQTPQIVYFVSKTQNYAIYLPLFTFLQTR